VFRYFLSNLVWNISHSKKSARYCNNCSYVFM
jgi:hypothetical protein